MSYLKIAIEYNNIHRPDTDKPVERVVKFEDPLNGELILRKDTLEQNKVFGGKELLDEFVKKCFRDHFEVARQANPKRKDIDEIVEHMMESQKPTY